MESICKRILTHCLDGSAWTATLLDDARRGLADPQGSTTFFRTVIEPLGDLFEPRLCTAYARLMSELLRQPDLADRYERVRQPRVAPPNAARVYVLSRITLGADIAVTSVLLDAAKRRYPAAEIVLVGPRKNWELYAGDPRIQHLDFRYGRHAGFEERIAARPMLKDGIVLDPDSRLSQCGLLPVTPDDASYFLFESRAYGGESALSLPELASQWCEQTLGVPGHAYIAPLPCSSLPPAAVTVNLGVGENTDKRIGGSFERDLLAMLPSDTIIDLGGSQDEADRVRAAAAGDKRLFQGPFADFAWLISRSRLYAGYDSAGMHAAAASGVPTLCVFAGAISDRFYERWKPTGLGPVRVVRPGPDALAQCARAIRELGLD